MNKHNKYLFILIIIPVILFPQDINKLGYLRIETDTIRTALFIDGFYIFDTPVNEIISIPEGMHEVSLLPPELDSPLLRDRLPDAFKKVYVSENDTVEVILRSADNDDQMEALKGESIISQYVGWLMMGMTIYIVFAFSG